MPFLSDSDQNPDTDEETPVWWTPSFCSWQNVLYKGQEAFVADKVNEQIGLSEGDIPILLLSDFGDIVMHVPADEVIHNPLLS